MKRTVLGLLFALVGALANADSPDGHGLISGGGSLALVRPSEKANFRVGSVDYQGHASTRDAGEWNGRVTLPVKDYLSVTVFGAGYGASMDYFEHDAAGGSQNAVNGWGLSRSQLGGGLIVYPGAVFGPAFALAQGVNPDGALYWPSLKVELSSHSDREIDRPFGTAVANPTLLLNEDYKRLGYRLTLPWSTLTSVTWGYARQFDRSVSYGPLGGGSSLSLTDGGAEEELSGVLTYFGHPGCPSAWEASAGLPHVGLPGALRLDLAYAQAYRTDWGKLSSREYKATATYALGHGVGLSLSYAFSEQLRRHFPDNADFLGLEAWAQNLGAGLSYAWGQSAQGSPAGSR